MRTTRSLSRLVAVVTVLALLGGCGLFSSDDDNDAALPEGEEEEEVLSEDDRLADEALLTVDEFPDGWTESEFSPALATALQQGVPECSDARALGEFEAQSTGSAGLRQFVSATGDRADVTVWVFPDVPTAISVMSELESVSALVITCFTAILEAGPAAFGIEEGVPITPVFEPDSGLGDESMTTKGPENAEGRVTVESSIVRVDRAIITILTVALDAEVQPQEHVDAAVERARSALT